MGGGRSLRRRAGKGAAPVGHQEGGGGGEERKGFPRPRRDRALEVGRGRLREDRDVDGSPAGVEAKQPWNWAGKSAGNACPGGRLGSELQPAPRGRGAAAAAPGEGPGAGVGLEVQ